MNAIDETVQSMVAHGSDVLILLYEDYITWCIGDAIPRRQSFAIADAID